MAFSDVYTGANGTLTLAGAGTSDGSDEGAILETYTIEGGAAVGRVTGVEIHVETDLEEFHEIGHRHATSLHPGNIHIWGKVDRAYVNGALLYLLLGRGAATVKASKPYAQPALNMNIILEYPADPEIRSQLDVYGVKFENWSFSHFTP